MIADRPAARKAAAAKWIDAMSLVGTPSNKLVPLDISDAEYERYHSLLQRLPSDLPSGFTSLVATILDPAVADHRYRVVWCGVIAGRLFKGEDIPLALPASWEDGANLHDILVTV